MYIKQWEIEDGLAKCDLCGCLELTFFYNTHYDFIEC